MVPYVIRERELLRASCRARCGDELGQKSLELGDRRLSTIQINGDDNMIPFRANRAAAYQCVLLASRSAKVGRLGGLDQTLSLSFRVVQRAPSIWAGKFFLQRVEGWHGTMGGAVEKLANQSIATTLAPEFGVQGLTLIQCTSRVSRPIALKILCFRAAQHSLPLRSTTGEQ